MELLLKIERSKLDGSVEAEQAILEHVRGLHVLEELRRTMFRPIAKQRIKAASADKRI